MCGNGVMSRIDNTSIPEFCSVRIADSRPEPGPLTNTSTLRRPRSCAVLPQSAAACEAAYGVFFFDPLKPILPALDHEMVCPWLFVSVTMILLNVALICA